MPQKEPTGSRRPPNYREDGKQYQADNCRALREAARKGDIVLHALGRAGYPGLRLGGGQLPGLRSVGYWNAGPGQKWGLPPHRNEGIEISFIASGRTPVAIEGKSHLLSHDEFLITRPWQPHQIGNPHIGACKLVWLIIDVGVRRPHQPWRWPDWVLLNRGDREMLTRCLRQNEQFIWRGSSEIHRSFLSMARAVEEHGASDRTSRLALCINDLLLALLEVFQRQKIPLRKNLTSAERSVSQFVREMEASLDQPWSLELMAESCRLGVTRFVHLFREQTNLTPVKFLNLARIRKACDLLADQPGVPITEIAFACGFSSCQYFANVFTRQMGRSPRAYRAGITASPPAGKGQGSGNALP